MAQALQLEEDKHKASERPYNNCKTGLAILLIWRPTGGPLFEERKKVVLSFYFCSSLPIAPQTDFISKRIYRIKYRDEIFYYAEANQLDPYLWLLLFKSKAILTPCAFTQGSCRFNAAYAIWLPLGSRNDGFG